MDEAGDFFVLRGDASSGIDHEDAEVGSADAGLGAHDAEDFHGIGHFAPGSDAGRIDEEIRIAMPFVGDVDGVAGGSGDIADQGALVFEESVCEGRFPDIWSAYDGDFYGIGGGAFLEWSGWREKTLHPSNQGKDAPVVFSADSDVVFEAQLTEFSGMRGMLLHINLVDDQDNRFSNAAQLAGEIAIERSESGLAIDDEEKDIGRDDGEIDFRVDLFTELCVDLGADAAGVEEGEGCVSKFTGAGDAVPRDAGAIVDDGDFAAGEAIKEGGLPDIGSSYDGGGALRHGSGSFLEGFGVAVAGGMGVADSCDYVLSAREHGEKACENGWEIGVKLASQSRDWSGEE